MKKIFLIIVLLMSPIFAQKNTTLLFNSEDAITDTGITIKTNLVAYWALEDTTDSHSTNELINVGVTFASGKVNNAGTFVNTENDWLYAPYNANLDTEGEQDFTIALWVKLTSALTAGLFSQSDGVAAEKFRLIFASSLTPDDVTFGVSTDGTNSLTAINATNGMSAGTWYFVIAWRNSTTDSIYVQTNNGTIFQNAFTGSIFQSNNNTALGKLSSDLLTTTNDLNGQLDEVAFWKRVLTPAERTYLYNNGTGRTYTGGKIQ